MTKSRHINKQRHRWTDTEVELLRRAYADTPTKDIAEQLGLTTSKVYAQAKRIGLTKSAAYLASDAACRLTGDGDAGKAYRFKPGQVPANKGTKGVTGVQEACRSTQFKPGQRPVNEMPIGSYRVNKDGRLEIKLTDLPGPYFLRWKPVHRHVWELANGEAPAGHCIAFKPGRTTVDPALITIDALECITLAENLQRNSIQRLTPEMREIAYLRGVLTRAINDRRKEPRP